MICFRVDMNSSVAAGHVMRCLSIANAVRDLGSELLFLTSDETAASFIEGRGFPSLSLGTDWRDYDSEIDLLTDRLTCVGAHTLLVDSYSVTEHYFQALRNHVRTAYLDDLNRAAYDLDLLIRYAVYHERFGYEKAYSSQTKLLLGPKYFPLRTPFTVCAGRAIRADIETILLLSGGTDGGSIEKLSEALAGLEGVRLNIVCGFMSEAYDRLRARFTTAEHVRIYKAVDDLDRFMNEADLAVSAGGTTLYELCACGTPAISYSFADNQLFNVREFEQMGLIPYAGDMRSEDVAGNVLSLLSSCGRDARAQRSKTMRNLVDGKGAERIARALIELDGKN